MNHSIILSGGTGTRLGGSIPKQYIEVDGKPIIAYCLERFQKHCLVDSIIIVASYEWYSYLEKWTRTLDISKFIAFAPAGSSRQHSIANGLHAALIKGAIQSDAVIIHDAARPNVSEKIIAQCIENLKDFDGVMPALPMKDTVYFSEKGDRINKLIPRDNLYAGQAPEGFNFGKYYHIHENLTEEELGQIRGSSEIAVKHGLKIKIIPGDEENYKITTFTDLEKFISENKK